MKLSDPRLLPRLLRRCSLAAVAFGGLTGCHSHYVAMDVHNATGQPITLIEVDYPSASFGVDTLAAGADYHYRFKVLGDGQAKILWTDPAQHSQTSIGPSLREGQEGTLTVTITGASAAWQSHLESN